MGNLFLPSVPKYFAQKCLLTQQRYGCEVERKSHDDNERKENKTKNDKKKTQRWEKEERIRTDNTYTVYEPKMWVEWWTGGKERQKRLFILVSYSGICFEVDESD